MSDTKIRVGMRVMYQGRVYDVMGIGKSGIAVIHNGYEEMGVNAKLLTPLVVQRHNPKPLKPDMVNHPPHYTSSAARCLGCGRPIECIDVIEHLPANLANAVKYAWRCDLKNASPTEDLRKAIWYLQREIERRERLASETTKEKQ